MLSSSIATESEALSKNPDEVRAVESEEWRLTHKLGRELGDGGYGIVHEVIHTLSGDARALKRPRSRDVDVLARLRYEIEALEKIQHENVVRLCDRGGGDDWFTMPLLGPTFAEAAQGMDDNEIARAMIHSARGLHHAHSLRMIHRDVKPSNILRDDRTGDDPVWLVADFGLVRRPSGATTNFRTRGPVGTDGFIAPEIAMGDHGPVEAAADVYSLGRTIAWATTGKVPSGLTPLEARGEWAELVSRMTALVPAQRLQSMPEVIVGIQEVVKRQSEIRKAQWGRHFASKLRAHEERVVSWIVNHGSQNGRDVTANDGTFADMQLSPGLIRIGLRQLVERGYLQHKSVQDEDFGTINVWTLEPAAWDWATQNHELLDKLNKLDSEPPARSGRRATPKNDDDIPF